MDNKAKRVEFMKYAIHSYALQQLELKVMKHVRENKTKRDYCAISVWYGAIKPKVCALVGWSAKDEQLKGSQAYDAVYSYLYNLLPDCKHNANLSCVIRQEHRDGIF